MVRSRLCLKWSIVSCGVAKVCLGRSGSGARDLCERSTTAARIKSSVNADFWSGAAAACTILVTLPKIRSSLRAMCSAHSATDQVFSSGLKFHWAGERPATESRNCWRLAVSSAMARSRSASVRVAANAGIRATVSVRRQIGFFILTILPDFSGQRGYALTGLLTAFWFLSSQYSTAPLAVGLHRHGDGDLGVEA